MKYAALLASLLLVACGADGQPQPPAPGIAVTGEASIGITTAKPTK